MKLWSSIKLALTITCEESTRLVSQSLDAPLPRGQRWAVRLHALICRSCRRFRRQLELIRQASQWRGGEPDATLPVSVSLTAEARARLQRALADEADLSPPSSL